MFIGNPLEEEATITGNYTQQVLNYIIVFREYKCLWRVICHEITKREYLDALGV